MVQYDPSADPLEIDQAWGALIEESVADGLYQIAYHTEPVTA